MTDEYLALSTNLNTISHFFTYRLVCLSLKFVKSKDAMLGNRSRSWSTFSTRKRCIKQETLNKKLWTKSPVQTNNWDASSNDSRSAGCIIKPDPGIFVIGLTIIYWGMLPCSDLHRVDEELCPFHLYVLHLYSILILSIRIFVPGKTFWLPFWCFSEGMSIVKA